VVVEHHQIPHHHPLQLVSKQSFRQLFKQQVSKQQLVSRQQLQVFKQQQFFKSLEVEEHHQTLLLHHYLRLVVI